MAHDNQRDTDDAPAVGRSRNPLRAVFVVALVVLIVVVLCAAALVFRPPFVQQALESLGLERSQAAQVQPSSRTQAFAPAAERDTVPGTQELAALEAQKKANAATPFVAQYADLQLRSPIRPADLTGILFHQASYGYALALSTELPQADYDTVADNRSMRINREQEGGGNAWLDAEALHLWRTADDTDMDTSIDVGAAAGTTVVSPVDGTVVLIRDYRLYDELDDIEIHIQPDGHPELDVVLIHTADPLVKAGDRVEAGITSLSHVRDIESALTDVQLGFFTPEGVGGNHTHVQVNDATYPEYREKRLEGAITVN